MERHPRRWHFWLFAVWLVLTMLLAPTGRGRNVLRAVRFLARKRQRERGPPGSE